MGLVGKLRLEEEEDTGKKTTKIKKTLSRLSTEDPVIKKDTQPHNSKAFI